MAEMHLLRETQNKKSTDSEIDEHSVLFMDLNHTSRGAFIFILTFQNTATKMYVDIL